MSKELYQLVNSFRYDQTGLPLVYGSYDYIETLARIDIKKFKEYAINNFKYTEKKIDLLLKEGIEYRIES